MSFTDYVENAVINWLRGTAMPTAPATLYCGLFTTEPTDAGVATEASYTNYARVPITLTAPPSPVSNSAAVTFAAVGGSSQTFVSAGLFDAATGGNALAYDPTMVDKTVAVGDVPEFAAGAFTFNLN